MTRAALQPRRRTPRGAGLALLLLGGAACSSVTLVDELRDAGDGLDASRDASSAGAGGLDAGRDGGGGAGTGGSQAADAESGDAEAGGAEGDGSDADAWVCLFPCHLDDAGNDPSCEVACAVYGQGPSCVDRCCVCVTP